MGIYRPVPALRPGSSSSTIKSLSSHYNDLTLGTTKSHSLELDNLDIDRHPASSLRDVESETLINPRKEPKIDPNSPNYFDPPCNARESTQAGVSQRMPLKWLLHCSRRSSWGWGWSFEIAALTLSLGFMIAIIVILQQVSDQPLRNWMMPLQPNTLIALFSTFSKSAMLLVVSECISQLKWVYFEQRAQRLIDLQIFDDASRGPLGAISLLCRVRWHAAAASGGAILVILAVAQDAFYQEVYSTYTKGAVQVGESAALPWTRSYDSLQAVSSADRGFSASLLEGLTSHRSSLFSCPSGNCTWPPFETLGICSTCRNVTRSVQKSCDLSERHGTLISCNYTFDDSLVVSMSAKSPPSTKATGSILNSSSINGFDASVFRVGIVRIDLEQYKSIHGVSHLDSLVAHAYDCEFTWCKKVYGPTIVKDGIIQNQEISQSAFLPAHENASLYTAHFPNCADQPGRTMDLHVFQDAQNTRNLSANNTKLMKHLLAECPDIKNISAKTISYIVSELDSILLQYGLKAMLGRGAYDTQFLWESEIALLEERVYSANDGDIPRTFDMIAESLTRAIRSGPQMLQHDGTVYRTEVFMQVDWQWLAFPAALLSFATLFLVISLIFSVERSRAVWKSSSIATLFHPLQGWPKDMYDHESVQDMEVAAKNMPVRLARDESGHFVLMRV